MNGLVITTSWDDGDPADMRLATALAEHGLSGTFYVCRHFAGHRRLSESDIRELASMPGMEVGSHTLTHPDLRKVDDDRLQSELSGARSWLEDVLQAEVTAFCYPGGHHDRRCVGAVARAGYRFARTTRAGSTGVRFQRYRMPTTMQLYPHGRSIQLRHAIHEGYLGDFWRILRLREWPKNAPRLARRFLDRTDRLAVPALLHVWGHSWELDEQDLWGDFRALLHILAEPRAAHVTNSGALDLVDGGQVRP